MPHPFCWIKFDSLFGTESVNPYKNVTVVNIKININWEYLLYRI